MDQTEMRERAGIRNRRIHPSAGSTTAFRRRPRGILRQEKEIPLRREGGDRLQHEVAGLIAQEAKKRKARRLSVRRSAIETGWAMGPGNYPVDDAENRVGKSSFRMPGKVCRMDPRREIA